jgi:hypothetical protein
VQHAEEQVRLSRDRGQGRIATAIVVLHEIRARRHILHAGHIPDLRHRRDGHVRATANPCAGDKEVAIRCCNRLLEAGIHALEQA